MSDILVVCEGNTCRSPYVALALVHALGDRTGLTVTSAGVRAPVGEPIDDTVGERLASRGVGDLEDHRARQLTADDVRGAALVLTASRRIRSKVVALHAPAVQYSFTLRQFDAMLRAALEHDPALTTVRVGSAREMLLDLVAGVRSARGVVPTRAVENDDVVDPVGRSTEIFDQAFAEMDPVLETLTAVVRGWAHDDVRSVDPAMTPASHC